jgi:hypothetical protein
MINEYNAYTFGTGQKRASGQVNERKIFTLRARRLACDAGKAVRRLQGLAARGKPGVAGKTG